MWFSWVSRPIIVPLSVGAAGLWYGSYDLTRMMTSLVISRPPVESEDKKSRFIRFLAVVAVGGAVVVTRGKFFPISAIPDNAGSSNLLKSMRAFPLKHHISTLLLSGVVSGVFSQAYDRKM